jgi:hypothetical protein
MPVYSAELRRKALHAAMAVTMGAAIVACGSEDTTPDPDADVSGDASADAAADVSIDVAAACSGNADGICGDTCTRDNDADCCEADSLCYWSVENSTCGCAVEGPFAPPSLPLRSGTLRSAAVA